MSATAGLSSSVLQVIRFCTAGQASSGTLFQQSVNTFNNKLYQNQSQSVTERDEMSTFEKSGYQWRETYFVLFRAEHRPTIAQMEKTLKKLGKRFDITNLTGDEEGHFESVTLLSPTDYSAIDLCFLCGEEVTEQGEALATEMRENAAQEELDQIKKIPTYDARIDVLHFQDIAGAGVNDDPDELDEMFDPSALLIVMESIVSLTAGVAVDPQSGTFY